ncbi:MAG: inositol monophosphatase [Patescibacteria group bacterium]
MNPDKRKHDIHYEAVRTELEAFLPSVGQQVLALRQKAETDPDFARLKADRTIVTKADELAETLIRAWITERFPEDSIRGEEQEQKVGGARVWIIDPIDGTYNFSHTADKFGISVGLVEQNDPMLGVIFYPAEDVILSSARDSTPLLNGIPMSVSAGKQDITQAMILASLHPTHNADPRFAVSGKQLNNLLNSMHHGNLGWSFTFDFLHFLQSDADAISHPGPTPYDIGAMCSIAKELHLTISDYDGKSLDFSKDIMPILISKNHTLHRAIIKKLNQK